MARTPCNQDEKNGGEQQEEPWQPADSLMHVHVLAFGVPCLHVWCGVYASPEAHSVRVRENIWREPHVTKMKKKQTV